MLEQKINFQVSKPLTKSEFEIAQKRFEKLNQLLPESWRDRYTGLTIQNTFNIKAKNGYVIVENSEKDDKDSDNSIAFSFRETKNYSVNPFTSEALLIFEAIFEIASGITDKVTYSSANESIQARVLSNQVDHFLLKGETADEWGEEENEWETT